MLARLSRVARPLAAASVTAAGFAYANSNILCASSKDKPDALTRLRSQEYTLSEHYHGKARVRVLRVRRQPDGTHTVQQYSVETRLFSPEYDRVFTQEDNEGLVATDTQKNTVYVVAKRSSATTPEDFSIDLASHLLNEYPVLSAVEVDVSEDLWRRYEEAHEKPWAPGTGEAHEHGFVRVAPERSTCPVRLTRDQPTKPIVTSGLSGLTVLKTTQSGFTNYHKDAYTLLPETTERCMATEMKLEWSYTTGASAGKIDYASVRSALRSEMLHAYFGPAKGGIYSPSLQATIYDAGCLVLKALPQVKSISIYTPNIHMIPFIPLKDLGGPGKATPFEDDVYVATSDPAGTIHCTVSRS